TSSTAAVAPARTYRQAGSPGYRAGKCHTPNANPTSTRMTSTPALAPTGTPNQRPNDTVARIPSLLRPQHPPSPTGGGSSRAPRRRGPRVGGRAGGVATPGGAPPRSGRRSGDPR